MNVVGIICEYNPFHNGHLYHLQAAKKASSSSAVVCVMSGNFTQRGEPSIVNKWARTEMAIAAGADVVFELPVLYATRSAYWFARGGIETLHSTGVVSHLAFGAENVCAEAMQETVKILTHETAAFRKKLKHSLKQGMSYPKARSTALKTEFPGKTELWSKPNNVLALTYLQVLQELDIKMQPVIIKRQGLGYESLKLQEGVFPSATALRNELSVTQSSGFLLSLEKIHPHLPAAAYMLLKKEYLQGCCPVTPQTFSPQIMTLLRRSTEKEICQIVDVTEGLENRISALAQECGDTTEFLGKLKTKRFTYTRLQRFLIHLLLNYTRDNEKHIKKGPPYLRVLGFSKKGQTLLKTISSASDLPVIVKAAHAKKYCRNDESFNAFWEMDTLATNLYNLAYPEVSQRTGNQDYRRGPVLQTDCF